MDSSSGTDRGESMTGEKITVTSDGGGCLFVHI